MKITKILLQSGIRTKISNENLPITKRRALTTATQRRVNAKLLVHFRDLPIIVIFTTSCFCM